MGERVSIGASEVDDLQIVLTMNLQQDVGLVYIMAWLRILDIWRAMAVRVYLGINFGICY